MTDGLAKRQHIVKYQRPARSPAGDAFSLLAITSLRLAGHLTAAGDALSEPSGQTSARWQVLAGARNGTLSVAEIARLLGLSRQAVQRLADVLEKEGLIAYAENPRHQRAKLAVLTQKGAARLSEIEARQAKWADALGADFTVAEMNRAQKLLARVIAALAKDKGESG
jgi:DNA-binding MarR family transcriptional regulator